MKTSTFTKSNFLAVLFMLSVLTGISNTPMLRLKMNGLVNSLDETVIYYQDGATADFDPDFDAYKLFGPNPAPHIYQEYNSNMMAINGIAPVSQTFSISIKATTNITGNFTITASDFGDLPTGTCVNLKDLQTGTTVDILIGNYVFNLSNTTTTARFVLSITHLELPFVSQLTQPSCQFINDGKYKVTAGGNGPWNYLWKDSVGTVVKASLNVAGSDSLTNLINGNYSVEIRSLGDNCYSNTDTFSIIEKVAPVASFVSPDTITASISQNYTPLNQSVNCTVYTWDFGDGGSSFEAEPAYNYSVAGTYQAKLIGTSATGCKDSTLKSIRVLNLATKVMNEISKTIKLADQGNNTFSIIADNSSINEMDVDLIDMSGKVLMSEHKENINETGKIMVDLGSYSVGIYVLNVSYKNQSLISSKVLVK
jgi:PKD repeat protein